MLIMGSVTFTDSVVLTGSETFVVGSVGTVTIIASVVVVAFYGSVTFTDSDTVDAADDGTVAFTGSLAVAVVGSVALTGSDAFTDPILDAVTLSDSEGFVPLVASLVKLWVLPGPNTLNLSSAVAKHRHLSRHLDFFSMVFYNDEQSLTQTRSHPS